MVALSISRAAESAHLAAPVRVVVWTEVAGVDTVATGADAQAVQPMRTRISFAMWPPGKVDNMEAIFGPIEWAFLLDQRMSYFAGLASIE
jgi:hypothetical protein